MSCLPSGYGSQYLALKYLNANVQHYKICEWAVKSIQAYNDLHIQDYNNYSENLSDDEVLDYLVESGVSINYNEPATRNQLKRQNYRKIYNNIIATNNLVNIQNAKGKDFEIINKNKYDYIMTYSFPCQDLSLAGKRAGMNDTSTRSGMLWEVERILNELKELNQLPQILLMENVPQVHGIDNVEHFNKWQLALENMGYKNYFQDLIATDYGIPQTRNRSFMVSILGDYSYTFPKPIPLKLKLSDLLEKEVSDKYLVKEGTVKCFLTQKENGFPRRERFLQSLSLTNNKDLAGTLTALQGGKATDNHILVKNATKQGYLEAKIGDGIDNSSRMEYHRGTVQKQKAQTLMTNINVGTLTDEFKIRNLTPKECFRIMGVKDEDYENVAKNQSDSSLYHLAGDSIVVNVLMAIFKEML